MWRILRSAFAVVLLLLSTSSARVLNEEQLSYDMKIVAMDALSEFVRLEMEAIAFRVDATTLAAASLTYVDKFRETIERAVS